MLLNWQMDWQYDGGLGFWLTTAYAMPALLLTEPLRSMGSTIALEAAFYFLVLAVASLAFLHARRRRRATD